MLERGIPAIPKMYFFVGDVRDVAQAHIKAMTIPEAAGKRHIVYGQGMWLKEIAQILSKEFKPQGNIPILPIDSNFCMQKLTAPLRTL